MFLPKEPYPGTCKQYSVRKVLYSTIPPEGSKSGNARDGSSWKGMSTKNAHADEA
jgi:hypothetical protein